MEFKLNKTNRLRKPEKRTVVKPKHDNTETAEFFAANLKPPTSNQGGLNKPKEPMQPKQLMIFLVAFLVIWIPSIVHADMTDILSYFEPYISVEEEYTDNINLTATNKTHDFITTISPGLRFSTLPRGVTTGQRQALSAEQRFGMDLDFRAGLVFYAREEDKNYTSLNGLLNAWYLPTPNLAFRVRDYLIRSDEIREQDYAVTAIPGQYLIATERVREPYVRNVVEPSVEYRFGRENIIGINYRNNVYEIDSRVSEDSMENYINPRLAYWFDIRNGVSFEYGLTFADFERSADFTGHMAAGRYTYRFNPRTSIFGDYTYFNRDFDFPSIDYVVYRPTIGMDHAFSPTLSAHVQVGYFWQDPDRGSTQDGFYFDVSATQRAERTTYTLAFQGGYAEDYFTSENVGFTKYYRGIGTISHQLFERMTVGLRGSMEYAAIPSIFVDQRDFTLAISGNASYQILRWLGVSLDFGYRENHSNFDANDYSEYRGIFRITATL